MVITTEAPVQAEELTYDAYMAEPEVKGRYDIVHGVRVFQPPVSWRRQRIILHLSAAVFGRRRTHGDRSVLSPFDLLIRREPLQIRQPDLLLISHERLMQNGAPRKSDRWKLARNWSLKSFWKKMGSSFYATRWLTTRR